MKYLLKLFIFSLSLQYIDCYQRLLFLGDLRSHDTQTRCEVQDEEDPEADVEDDDEEPDAPLPGSGQEDGALRISRFVARLMPLPRLLLNKGKRETKRDSEVSEN